MIVVFHDLHAEFPLRVVSTFDRLVEILGGVIEVRGLDLVRLGLRQGLHPLLRLPVVLHQHGLTGGIHPLVRVDPEAFLVPVIRWNATRAEEPRQHVHGFRREAHEIEDPLRILNIGHRIRLQGVDHIRELDGIANEEHRQVVADQVPVAILCVELHREAAWVTQRLGRGATVNHGREAYEHGRALALLLEELGPGVLRDRLVADSAVRLEEPMGACAARVHHPLRDPLAVEMRDLLDECVVFQGRGPTIANSAHVLVIDYRMSLACRQRVLCILGLGHLARAVW